MNNRDFDADVLVVGMGPAGVTLAGLLARNGISVLAVDRSASIHPLPRAVHFDAEIMRIFQDLGLVDALRPHIVEAPDYEFRTASGQVLFCIASRPATPFGWASGYMFHQPGLEGALRDLVTREPNIQIRLERSFESFEQDPTGINVSLTGPDGPEQVRVRYLVGCDGGPSPVREYAGLKLDNFEFDEPWLVVDVKVGEGTRVPEINLQICDPARPTTCVLTGPGRHRWEFMMLPGETVETALADGFVDQLIASWDCGPNLHIERKAVYRFHGLIAEQWRSKRVLIAGDAAHQMPPMAGQGMCSGIRDAFNLAWKLAAVLRGEANETLLDSYQDERAPHAREVIEFAIGLGRVVCAIDPAVAAVRDKQMLAAREAGVAPPSPGFSPFKQGFLLDGAGGAGEMFPQPVAAADHGERRLDDVLGGGAWLITRDGQSADIPGWAGQHVALDDDRMTPFRAVLDEWLDRQGADAVLVRPDRVVFGAGPASALASAYRRGLSAEQAKAA